MVFNVRMLPFLSHPSYSSRDLDSQIPAPDLRPFNPRTQFSPYPDKTQCVEYAYRAAQRKLGPCPVVRAAYGAAISRSASQAVIGNILVDSDQLKRLEHQFSDHVVG